MSPQNEAFQASVRQHAERREAEMKAIKLMVQMNLLALCREKVTLDDEGTLPENAVALEVSERLATVSEPSSALTTVFRMVADEAVRKMARLIP